MTAKELELARDLVEDMQQCVINGHYFEISTEHADLLARYIRELERCVTRHTSISSAPA